MQFTVLGSGTSTGIPSVACSCDVCKSSNPKNKRLRASLLVQSATTSVVIDTSSDFREQMLTHNVMHIDGIVYTHHHFDHIGGFDDLRPFAFESGKPVPLFGMHETLTVLKSTFPYAFGLVTPTGASVPDVALHEIGTEKFSIGDIVIQPIPLLHGNMNVLGFRIGDVAYCTDTNQISDTAFEILQGLDVLILDGLRWQEHPTHYTIPQAIDVIQKLQPRQAYLTHISHHVDHADEARLPNGINLAYDGLVIRSDGNALMSRC